ncbi:uncharacterized protein SETTUDRAFT_152774 [Exserohilum turcica Et28A]|uniref:Cytochrome P450 n=1 Tax=Exserohilum turcicum (strain 28A) TaxID=671987 RepID=R0KFW9_EXST2|nr:uncharacterized protein SETTUDRAFT_152774 [Exserohilum turcica Et28A]EOA91723.1 hypothetical protein SETTUDRAFT_152774 [Exserohilum turcica Et28A]
MYRVYVGDMHTVQRQLHEQYGPVVRIGPNEVSTADLSTLPQIYRNQRPLIKTDFYSVWGGGTISEQLDLFAETNERVHSNRRRTVNPVYTLTNVLKNETYINKVSELFIQRLGEFADRGESLDFGEWLQMYTFDVVGEIFFGSMFGFLEHSKDHEAYIASLDALMPVLCVAAVASNYMRPLVMGSAIAIPVVFKALKALESIRNAAVIATKKRVKEVEDGKVPRNDMLQQLFDIVQEKGEKANFSGREVTLEAYVAMLAGSDTTAIAFRATFYYLVRNPEMLRKAQAEIDAAVAAGLLSSPVKYSEATTKLPYICASIKEAMRMHPSVGLSMQRYAPEEGIETGNKFIPKGYRIGMNPAVVHFDKQVFGDDADEFRPERWLVSEEQWKAMDKCLLTFGAGTRTCVGKNISLVELHTLVPEVLRHFKLEMTHDQPWTTSNRWFNKQTGLTMKFVRR